MPTLTAVQIKVTVFDVANAAPTYTSYTLENTPFLITPDWTDNIERLNYSQYQIIWDLGDGTYITGTSARHTYKYPGIYNVTATFFDSQGEAYTITAPASLTAFNAMPDTIVFSNLLPTENDGIYLLPAGRRSKSLEVFRFNSWQNDQFLAEDNYTINFYASGSNSSFLSVSSYYTDKYAHLRTYFGFVETTVNADGAIDTKLVDSTSTSSVSVYAVPTKRPFSWDIDLSFYSMPVDGSAFAGTSGSTLDGHIVSYVDQTPSDSSRNDLIFLFAQPRTTRFYDYGNINNSYYPSINFPTYGYINVPWKVQFLKSVFNPAASVAITSNGITAEGVQDTVGPLTGEYLHSFNIYPTKWTDTDIAFCCTFKDSENYTTKCYPPITGFRFDGQDPTQVNTISIGLYKYVPLDPLNFTNTSPTSTIQVTGATFTRNPSPPFFEKSGSYFCGLLNCSEEARTAVISAAVLIQDSPPLNLGITYGFAAQPGRGDFKRFRKRAIFSNCDVETLSFDIVGESTTYSDDQTSNVGISYAPLEDYNVGQNRVYITDSDNDKIFVYTVSGAPVATIDLAAAATYQGANVAPNIASYKGSLDSASPSNVTIDSTGNAWISLYDAISAIKLDASTLNVVAHAEPNLQNIAYTDYRLYVTLKNQLSGFVGENSLLPTCVDAGVDDTVFVGYSHPVSGFIFKYSSTGEYLSAVPLNPLYSVQEIIVDRENNIWAAVKNLQPNRSANPFQNTDLIYKWDSNFNLQPNFPISSLANIGNITIDLNQNLWVNNGVSKVTKISPAGQLTDVVIGSQVNSARYYQPIGGIACDNEGFLWVLHNYNAQIYFYPITDLQQLPLSAIYSGVLPDTQYTVADGSRAFYSVFGDWTGIRWINKYVSPVNPFPRIIRGSSNLFDILKRSPIVNKINENFDQAAAYKSYILQESLFDRTKLLDDFLGQIVGNADSPPETLGKEIYEKIANFVGNISDPDTCNISALKSLFEQYGLDFYDFCSQYPSELTRAIDILSINQRKLFGSPNTFSANFGISAYDYGAGKNLGEQIDILTGTFNVGTPIVIYEKFSGIYKKVYNTVVPVTNGLSAVIGQEYPLSGVNYNWGWGLVTGNNAQSGIDIEPYYNFYKYKAYMPLEMVDGVIDFKNNLTTVTPAQSSYENWTQYGGTMEAIISRALYNGLEMV